MKKRLTYLIGLLLIVSCATKPNDFKNYLSQIKPIPTPIKFWTIGYTDKKIENKVDERLFEKYKSVYANEIFGKLYENKQTAGIIYTVYGDVLAPVLITYDKQGNRIDSLGLFDNASGYNLEKETFVSVTLHPDLTIQEVDSTFTYTLNDKGDDRIPGSDKLTVDSIIYSINENGKIIRTSPN